MTLKKTLGCEESTANLFMQLSEMVIKPNEYAGVHKFAVFIFNAGKNGIQDKDLEANFAEFYKLYPRKMSRKDALKAYRTAMKEVSHETIMEALRAQLPGLMTTYNTDKSFVKHPSVWLNKGCWTDETPDKAAPDEQTMTDAEIFSTSWGQQALKQGAGYTLRLFIADCGRKPIKSEYQDILDKPKGPYSLAENKKLEHYLKG